MTITVHSAVWENQEQTVMTVVFSNNEYKNLPFGVNLNAKDSSPISKEIIELYKAKKFIPSSYVKPVCSLEDTALSVRNKRNNLLTLTDVYVSAPDYPLTDLQKEDIKQFRQQLRDITKQRGFPDNVVWPTIPDCIKDKVNMPL